MSASFAGLGVPCSDVLAASLPQIVVQPITLVSLIAV